MGEATDDCAIVVKNISKKFGDVLAIDNVSFKVRKNSIFGLLGSNGAGKSTMISMLVGLLGPSGGEITILQNRVGATYPAILKKKVAIVPQSLSLYEDLSIYDNLYFFGNAYGLSSELIRKKIRFLSDTLRLGDIYRKVRHLSGGYQRRVSLAMALMGNPEIILLDEALVGIDLETREVTLNFLNGLKRDKTIIYTTHALEEAENLCDEIVFLHHGKKLKGGLTEQIVEEYAKKHPSEIKVTLPDFKEISKICLLLKKKGYNASSRQNILSIKSLSDEQDLSKIISILKHVANYRTDAIGFSIKKPGLNEIMLDLLSRERK